MIDFSPSQELPSTGIPAFGTGPRLAASSDSPAAAARGMSVEVQISRSNNLQSLVSCEPNLGPMQEDVVRSFYDGMIQPQLQRVKREPELHAARASAAAMLLALGKADEAVELLLPVTGSTEYWVDHYLALALARVGRREEAMALFETLATRYPGDYRPLHALARLLIEQSDWERAWKVLDQAIALGPRDAMVFNDAAAVLLARSPDQRDNAVRLLRRAIAKDMRCSLALNNLGVCHHVRGEMAKAKRYFTEAYQVDAQCAAAIHNLAECYISEQNFHAAAELLEQHLGRAPVDRHAKERLSWSYYRLGRLGVAIKLMEDVLTLGTERGPILNNLALFYAAQGDWNHSIETFSAAVKSPDGTLLIATNFAQLLASINRWKLILTVLTPASVRGDCRGVHLLANALLFANRPADAVDLLRENRDLFPQAPDLPVTLGFLLATRMHDPEGAVEVLREALEYHPNNPGLSNNLAYAFLSMNRFVDARAVLSPWIEGDNLPQSDHGTCLLASWGLLLMREGRFEEGVAFYQSARGRAHGPLRERIKQKLLIEEGRHLLLEGRRPLGVKKLREALRRGTDPEFAMEARALLHGEN